MTPNDFGVLLIMVLLLGGIAFFISYPLLRRHPEAVGEEYYEETPMHVLLSRKNSVYTGIKDLEFDYKTGKISDEDYGELRSKLEGQAVDVLKAIDELEKGKEPAARKAGERARLFCTACGFQYEEDDRFCPSCGTAT